MKRLVLLLGLLKCLLAAEKVQISRCQIFDKYGVKTFNDEIYHFDSSCGYTLARFLNNDVEVSIKLSDGVVYINVGDKQYKLQKNAKNETIFVSGIKKYTLPAKENDITASKPGTYFIATFAVLGLNVKWNLRNSVALEVDTNKNTDLSGICSSSEKANIDDWSEPRGCLSKAVAGCVGTLRVKSLQYCRQILAAPKYKKCLRVMPQEMVNNFLTVCMEKHCNCKSSNKNNCVCGIAEAFSKTCSIITDQPLEWRQDDFCPMKCPAGQEYKDCGHQKACGEPSDFSGRCIEGCVCPPQTYLYNGKCIPITECPCYYDGQHHLPKSSVTQDCNVCVCEYNNIWNCSSNICYEDGGAS